MKPQGIFLSWVVVEDVKKAIEFYTKTLGFTLLEYHEQYGWAELSAGNGSRLGLGVYTDEEKLLPGSNAVVTIAVDDLEASIKELKEKGVSFVGKVIDIPGHVKMQSIRDKDGNMLQLVQMYRQ